MRHGIPVGEASVRKPGSNLRERLRALEMRSFRLPLGVLITLVFKKNLPDDDRDLPSFEGTAPHSTLSSEESEKQY
jgi:hypothetical protein